MEKQKWGFAPNRLPSRTGTRQLGNGQERAYPPDAAAQSPLRYAVCSLTLLAALHLKIERYGDARTTTYTPLRQSRGNMGVVRETEQHGFLQVRRPCALGSRRSTRLR
jgi:hypothetical protein